MTKRNVPFQIPARSLAPNAITVLALCAGMFGVRFAYLEQWQSAVTAILVAGVFDGLDGSVARLLKGTSRFGAELDSLSDVISFGVAPALIMYMWVLSDVRGLGWLMSLVFVICMALRLARFNTVMKDNELGADVKIGYYTGIPAPASAALALWPMILSFEFDYEILKDPRICSAYMAVLCILTVSRIPTFSLKSLKIHKEHVIFVLLGIAVLASLLITDLWMTMAVIGIIYIISIPTIAILAYRKKD
ncbi:MAG: CDP-diacylglycerol--serine O-phosphatidyltransferase [Alphaproteobacteria bacterium]|nr:CDP-diacylglycerol--serine O-phosphatidyltransferase [Alphaproteobacteria bacterium]HPF46662.1 CDP-diacylglycerol--serine O-phosphatidyltransferase [Emcibacteraceae bacterium]HRW29506.1 CDP-diacylglycerol--serine O-phosphatidyltransferase [Emcibacteraceae bacterium]